MKVNRLKEGRTKSKPESEIYEILAQVFPHAVIYQNYPIWRILGRGNKNLTIDIWIATFRVGIEYQGQQHYQIIFYGNSEEDAFKAKRAFEELKERDDLKIRLFEEAGVPLKHIDYREWKGTLKDKKKILMDLL